MKSSDFQKKCFGALKIYVDNPAGYSKEYSVRTIRKFISSQKKGKKILDLGCADGELLGLFANEYQIFGVDIAAPLVKKARKKGLKAKVANLETLFPFAPHSFDILVAHHVIEHIVDTDSFLAQCNSVLRKNGQMLLTFPNINSPVSLIMFLLDLPAYQAARYRSLHVRDFTLRTIQGALVNNGFVVERVFGGSFLILKFNFLSFLTSFFPRLAGEITILVRKVADVTLDQKEHYDFENPFFKRFWR